MKIPFNVPAKTGQEEKYIHQAIESGYLAGDGPFTKKCTQWFNDHLQTVGSLLTPSCTHALEMAAFLIDVKPGDEIIMPSYTFVSTANAFVLRGATIVFVDIRPDNLNIDESKIEAAITPKTKAIVPVHYAGVACEMDTIMAIAKRHNLYVIEDAAQGFMSTYKGKALGTIGHMGAYSFHATKNFTSGGEGGLLIVNDEKFYHRAEVFREKGTDRSAFLRGDVDKYTWRDLGSSMLPSELQAAYLWAQLENIDALFANRMVLWKSYKTQFSNTNISHSVGADPCIGRHNGHIFFALIDGENGPVLKKLREQGVHATSHYEPLHLSQLGQSCGRISGNMENTERIFKQIVRLPIFDSLTIENIKKVTDLFLKLSDK